MRCNSARTALLLGALIDASFDAVSSPLPLAAAALPGMDVLGASGPGGESVGVDAVWGRVGCWDGGDGEGEGEEGEEGEMHGGG